MTKNKFSAGRRSFLLGLGGLSGATLAHHYLSPTARAKEVNQYISNLNKENIPSRGQSLRQLAAAKGILYGGFPQRSYQELPNDKKFQQVFTREYGAIVGGFFGVTVGPFGENNYKFSRSPHNLERI